MPLKTLPITDPAAAAKGRNGYFRIAGVGVRSSYLLCADRESPAGVTVEIHSRRTLGRATAACLFDLNRRDARALAEALLEATSE